jgi:hypothetical protein
VTASRRRGKKRDGEREAEAASPFLAGDPRITRRLERVLAAAIAKFAARPDATAVDLGHKIVAGTLTRQLCIRIHVREKHSLRHLAPRERVPAMFQGVPTDVVQAVYHDSQGNPRAQRAPNVQPGFGISHLNGGTGTLGLLVLDHLGRPGLLSASHVLVPDSNASPGDPILQPSRLDGGQPPDTVASLQRSDPDTDSAYALLLNTRPIDPTIFDPGAPIAAAGFPALGDVLEKSGRATDVTRAVVDGISLVMAGLRYAIHLAPLDSDAPPIALGGDSGALWYDPATNVGVGLHCKGTLTSVPGASFAIATSLVYVLRRLDLIVLP